MSFLEKFRAGREYRSVGWCRSYIGVTRLATALVSIFIPGMSMETTVDEWGRSWYRLSRYY